MGGNHIFPAVDTLVLTIPFFGMLAMTMFGLDERIATPRKRPGARRFFCETEGTGRAFLSDPDGKP